MARWSDISTWRGPTPNQGGKMTEVRGLVIHVADGYYEGTIAWQKNPSAQVSSHFVVAGPRDAGKTPDGAVAQIVDTDITAWTQRSGNGHWLSAEFSGFSGDALSPAQVEACAVLLARAHQVYGVPLQLATSPSGYGLGHHSMGAESGVDWGHSECPGEKIKKQKQQILDIAKGIDMPTADEIATAVWTSAVPHTETLDYAKTRDARTILADLFQAVKQGRSAGNQTVAGTWLTQRVDEMGVTLDAVKEELARLVASAPQMVTDDQLERVLRKVLGSLDVE